MTRRTKSQERKMAALDAVPFESKYFYLKYDDNQEFPWRLVFKSTLKDHTGRRRKFVAHAAAKQLDKLIDEAVGL